MTLLAILFSGIFDSRIQYSTAVSLAFQTDITQFPRLCQRMNIPEKVGRPFSKIVQHMRKKAGRSNFDFNPVRKREARVRVRYGKNEGLRSILIYGI